LFKNKKILALIPARSGSKGIKNKNIKLINGLPLIKYTFNFVNKLDFVDLKVVSSDSKKILKIAEQNKFIGIKRSKILSGDTVSDYQVILSVLNNKEIVNNKYDYLIYLQPTSPIREKKDLIFGLNQMIKKKFNSAWSVSKIDKKNHPLKVMSIKNNQLKLFNLKGKNIIARHQLTDIYIRNGVFYIFKINTLKKKKSIYLDKTLPVVINGKIINIDNLKDLNDAKKLLSKN
jgi:CMP-N,N'-diacetyllegionaminic acid synthase